MRTAIVYDRVNKWGGAERVLLALHEMYPDAPLYTAVYSPKKAQWAKVFPKVVPSFLQKTPFIQGRHEILGTFTPLAFETMDFSIFDLVISVTSEAAKGVITKAGTRHVCYCLTPTRYLWSGHDDYFKNPPPELSWIPFFWYVSRPFVAYTKKWDKIAATRPDEMVAISNAVKERIKKYYERDSKVVFPPVDTEKFTPSKKEIKENFYLLVSRLVPYKKADVAIAAFNKMGKRLVVVGSGSQKSRLKQMAKKNIDFVGELTDQELANYYRKARGLIFPQEEDFGIVAVEAQSSGTPVIAYRAGGALDTVIEGKTGVFFDKQVKESIIEAVDCFEKTEFLEDDLRENAERFSKGRFKKEFKKVING
jgi:glycosyltransferase involved in cell wall biosynthesis